jgi:hypothetical protein
LKGCTFIPFSVNNAISPLAIVVLPETLVGAAIINAFFVVIFTFSAANLKKICVKCIIYRKKLYLCTQIMAIWWLMPPDVRESGESPELYLQL